MIEKVKRYFDDEIRKHPSCFLDDRSASNFLVPSESYARALLGPTDRGLRVLEIGAGDCTDSIALAGSTNHVWAIDIAATRLARAQKNIHAACMTDRILPICMDAHHLAFPDNTFDLIVGNSVLLFLNKEVFLRECYRTLRVGGRAIFPNESMGHPVVQIRRWITRRLRERESITRRVTLEFIELMLEKFKGGSHREFYLLSVALAPFVPRFGHLRVVAALLGLVHRIDACLLRLFPVLRKYCWIAVIEVRRDVC